MMSTRRIFNIRADLFASIIENLLDIFTRLIYIQDVAILINDGTVFSGYVKFVSYFTIESSFLAIKKRFKHDDIIFCIDSDAF